MLDLKASHGGSNSFTQPKVIYGLALNPLDPVPPVGFSHPFKVDQQPVLVSMFPPAGEAQVQISPDNGTTFVDLIIHNRDVVLNAENTSVLIPVAGVYRLRTTATTSFAVYTSTMTHEPNMPMVNLARPGPTGPTGAGVTGATGPIGATGTPGGPTGSTGSTGPAMMPTPYDFGAVGDGVADDTLAMQDWLDAIEGGAGYGQAGTFVVSSTLKISSNTTIYGAGKNNFVIGKHPAAAMTMEVLQNKVFAVYPTIPTDHDIAIYGTCIQGIDAEIIQPGTSMITFLGVRNLILRDCLLQQYRRHLLVLSNVYSVTLDNNEFYNWGSFTPASEITGSTVYNSGTGYVVGDVFALPVDDTILYGAVGVVETVGGSGEVLTYRFTGTAPVAFLNDGGTGYVLNDTGVVDGGDGVALYTVTGVGGGGTVTSVTVTGGGLYGTIIGATTTTGGAQPGVGVGLTLDLYTADAGIGYLVAAGVATTATTGVGVGFTIDITTVGINTCRYDGGCAILMHQHTFDVKIKGNYFHEGQWTGITTSGEHLSITNNFIQNVHEAGIFGGGSFITITGNKITGVRIKDCSSHGIEIGGDNLVISSNEISNTDLTSIYLTNSVLCSVVGNICNTPNQMLPVGGGPDLGSTGAITFRNAAGLGQLGYNITISNNTCSDATDHSTYGIALYDFGGGSVPNLSIIGNNLGTAAQWKGQPIFISAGLRGADFVERDNSDSPDVDSSLVQILIPIGTAGSIAVSAVGFKPRSIDFQAGIPTLGPLCATSVGRCGWVTGWDIVAQVVSTTRTNLISTAISSATDGTDCFSSPTSFFCIYITDATGTAICAASVVSIEDDGFTLLFDAPTTFADVVVNCICNS